MDSIQRQSQNVPSSLFLCCLFIVHFSIEIFRARFVWFLSTGWFFHQRSGCQTDQSFVLKQHLCFSTEKKKEKRQRKEAKKRREFLSAEEGLFWAVVMTTIEARVIFSFRKRKKKKRRQDKTTTSSLTSFLTALFIAVVGAVVLAVASPWQPDAASGPAAELVGRAHGRGWRRRWHERGKKHTRSDTRDMFLWFGWKRPQLTAVLFVRLIVAVVFAVAPPAGVDAHPAAAHEFNWSAGLVGGYTHTNTHT